MSVDATDRHTEHPPPNLSREEELLGVEVVLTLGEVMLGAGSSTKDAEQVMRSTAAAIGLAPTTAVVSFNIISLSYYPGPAVQPITSIHFVPERMADYQRLSTVMSLVNDLHAGGIDVQGAASELNRITTSTMIWPRPLASLAQAASAAAFAVVFGGTAIDALATLLLNIIVQPIVTRLDRSSLPPFFRSLLGPLISALFVTATIAIGATINPALVLAGSILQFLPGSALVAGMRDLIDQSIISGAARLAEALLIGAAVASGTAIGIGLASQFGVALEVQIGITESWQVPIQVTAAAIACGAWAIRLGQRHFALVTASILGAIGWFAFVSAIQLGRSSLTATALAGLTIGAGSQILTRDGEAPVVLRVVPATYPLLPGLLIVNGMLSADAVYGLIQLSTAAATALTLGAAIAFGDILVQTIRQVREGGEPVRVKLG